MKHYRLFLLAVLAFLLTGLVFAQEQEYSISFTDEAIDVPEGVRAGFVTFTIENSKTEAPAVVDLARLNEGVTPESFTEAYFESIDNPIPVLELVTLYGGTEIWPASSITIRYELEAGTYVVIDFAGDMAFFEVLGDSAESTAEATSQTGSEATSEAGAEATSQSGMEATAEATADVNGTRVETTAEATQDANMMVEVVLDDFSFLVPLEIPAGEHVWHIQNVGEQWHEMAIYRITDDNLSNADVATAMLEAATSEEAIEPEGLEPVTIWLPMGAGQEAWVTWGLEEGRYVLACFLPNLADPEGMHSHIELGMIQFITVGGE